MQIQRTSILAWLSVGSLLVPHLAAAQIGGGAGAFSRMGFGARGIGMGNAMTAVTTGDLESYYNPALLPAAAARHGQVSFGLLTLDRSLNFLSYGQKLPPSAGIGLGIINAGVGRIDGRDADGEATGSLSTSENQFCLGFGLRFPPGFSLGLNVKLFYHRLYEGISSTTVGLDLGALYPVSSNLTVGATVRDIGSKYMWSTSSLYGQNGEDSRDFFPKLYALGAAYLLPDSLGVISGEIQFSSTGTTIGRIGAEANIIPELAVRAGIDRIDLRKKGNGVKPSLGLSVRHAFEHWSPSLEYAYVFEPFSASGINMISLSVRF